MGYDYIVKPNGRIYEASTTLQLTIFSSKKLLFSQNMSKERRPSVRATNYHEDLLASLLEEAALAGIPLIKPNLEIINVQKWLDENEKSFVPPVCNKLMHHT